MIIRHALKTDLTKIIEIYNASIPDRMATADTEPISVASRFDWFARHSPQVRPIWVVEIDKIIVGWLSFQDFYGRPAYQKTAELSIYITPNYQRCGIGKILIQQAIEQSPHLGIETLLGFVFAHNLASFKLFSYHQFAIWGNLPKIAELDGIERDLVILGRRI